MTLIDLSHFLEADMPVYPGTEAPVLVAANSIDRDGFREKKITFYSHTGTHMDAPAHIVPGAKTLDQLPVETFCGDAFLLNVTGAGRGEIDLRDLLAHGDAIRACDFLILYTGWSRYWRDERYFSAYPVLTANAARWLADGGLKGLGMDTISVDPSDSADLPIHHILLGAGLVIVENLTNLAALAGRPFRFSCFPLKIKDADGSPVRAVAMIS